jgi:hypothetical protein
MKTKYRVLASYVSYVYADIEADNINEAKEIAYDMDGGDFKQTSFGDWNIDEVIELEKVNTMFGKVSNDGKLINCEPL